MHLSRRGRRGRSLRRAHSPERVRLHRWLAVAAPSAGWVLWWARFGAHDRTTTGSLSDGVRSVLDGWLGSFEAVAAGAFVGGAALAFASACLLGWRTAHDRDAARMQVAWMAGVLVWWIGLVWSRENTASSLDTPRYEYVGAVFVLLSLIPPRPVTLVRRHARHPAIAALALVSILAVVAANHPSIRTGARHRDTIGTWVRNVLVEVDQGPEVVPDAQELPLFLHRLTAGELRALVDRRGRPMAIADEPDAYLVHRAAIIMAAEAPPRTGVRASTNPRSSSPAAICSSTPTPTQRSSQPGASGRRPSPRAGVLGGTTVRIHIWGPTVRSDAVDDHRAGRLPRRRPPARRLKRQSASSSADRRSAGPRSDQSSGLSSVKWATISPSTPSTRTRPRVCGGSSAEYRRMRQVGRLRSPRQPSWAEAWPRRSRPRGRRPRGVALVDVEVEPDEQVVDAQHGEEEPRRGSRR